MRVTLSQEEKIEYGKFFELSYRRYLPKQIVVPPQDTTGLERVGLYLFYSHVVYLPTKAERCSKIGFFVTDKLLATQDNGHKKDVPTHKITGLTGQPYDDGSESIIGVHDIDNTGLCENEMLDNDFILIRGFFMPDFENGVFSDPSFEDKHADLINHSA